MDVQVLKYKGLDVKVAFYKDSPFAMFNIYDLASVLGLDANKFIAKRQTKDLIKAGKTQVINGRIKRHFVRVSKTEAYINPVLLTRFVSDVDKDLYKWHFEINALSISKLSEKPKSIKSFLFNWK